MATVNMNEISDKRPVLTGDGVARILTWEVGKSKKGKKMATVEVEVCTPETAPDEFGKQQVVKGQKFTIWVILTQDNLKTLKYIHKAAKLPMSVDLDTINYKPYVGKAFNVEYETEPRVMREEKDNPDGTSEMVPMTDPDTGNPITTNDWRIKRFKSLNEEFTVDPANLPY